MEANLTMKAIEKLQATTKRQHIYDATMKGFGLRIEPAQKGGRKSYFYFVKCAGKPEFRALGQWPEVDVKQARSKAEEWAGKLSAWKLRDCEGPSPFEKERREKEPASAVPTFADLCEAYITRHLHDPKAQINHPDKAERDLRYTLKRYFGAWMGKRVNEITVADVVQLRDLAAKTPYAANRNVQLARALLGWCSAGKDGKINVWELSSNVASRVETFPEQERDRYLKPEEEDILEAALEGPEVSHDLKDFIRLCIDTGARKMSLLLAGWGEIDFDEEQWTVPAEHSKSGCSYTVDLLPRAIQILERRKAARTSTTPLIFPPISGMYLHLDKPFRNLMARIGGTLTDLRIHDLRRSCGAKAADAGASLEKVAKILGQESVAATSIYARISSESLREAREAGEQKRQERMAAARKRMNSAKVIAVPSRRGA